MITRQYTEEALSRGLGVEDVTAVTAKQVRQMLLKRGERVAAKSLRHAKESQETTIRGSVIQLHADPESDEAEDHEERQIIVKCDLGAVRAVKVHASLPADDYRKACDAHKDNREVEIEGRPEKLGKFWNLTSPRNFRVVPR